MSSPRITRRSTEYTVRVSSRAKYVRLKVSHKRGLEVVVPAGFDASAIPSILSRKHDWIERSLHRVREQLAVRAALSPGGRPETIELPAVGELWRVRYRPLRHRPRITLTEEAAGLLTMEGPMERTEVGDALLRRWLKGKGRTVLGPWLEGTSRELRLPYRRCSVRGQKTRWGSCSSHGTISLNFKLLFLPTHLVRYLFVHELCHTRHLDHSAKFWRLVRSREPDYQRLEAELNEAWRFVPLWVDE